MKINIFFFTFYILIFSVIISSEITLRPIKLQSKKVAIKTKKSAKKTANVLAPKFKPVLLAPIFQQKTIITPPEQAVPIKTVTTNPAPLTPSISSVSVKPSSSLATTTKVVSQISANKPVSNTTLTQFCPFILNFKSMPMFPTDVPNDPNDLSDFITQFNSAMIALNQFIKNYKTSLTSWQSNNDLQVFANLLATMNQNNIAYNNAKTAHTTCVNNVLTDNSKTYIRLQLTCNVELISYTKTFNELYDSIAKILNFLNKYKFAPAWANPVVRNATPAYVTDKNGKNIGFAVGGQNLQINTIQGFDPSSFKSQVIACQSYLKTQLQDCYTAISNTNTSINNMTNKAIAVQDKIKTVIASLLASRPDMATAKIESAVGLGLGLATAPEFTVATMYLDNLSAGLGGKASAVSEFMGSIGNQINKELIRNWSSIDIDSFKSGQGLVYIIGGVGDIAGMLAFGLASATATAVADVIEIISNPQPNDPIIMINAFGDLVDYLTTEIGDYGKYIDPVNWF